MELINARYRIIKNLYQNGLVSSYLSSDMKKNNKIVQINIINSEYVNEELIDYYNKKFISLSNILNKNILELYSFGLVNSIDNKILAEEQYYYTNEYFEGYSLNDFLMDLHADNKLHIDEIIDIFIQLCRGVKYFHLNGYTYENLNLKNVFINNNKTIKLKDIATIKLEKSNVWHNSREYTHFKAPEVRHGKGCSKASDIYSLGIILLLIYIQKNDSYVNLHSELNNLKDTDIKDSTQDKIIHLVSNMTRSNENERYKDIDDIIDDINNLFNKEYKSFSSEELEVLHFNTEIVGRDKQIQMVEDSFNNLANEDAKINMIIFHSEQGSGKTRLLREIQHRFKIKRVNIFSSFCLENLNENNDKVVHELLKGVLVKSDKEVIERYESELIKVIPELGDARNVLPSESLDENKERLRLKNRIANFIFDSTKSKPTMIIIDNIHLADDFALELIEYMMVNPGKNNKILFILSCCNEEYVLSKEFKRFLSNVGSLKNNKSYYLNGLSIDETAYMIKNILNMASQHTKLASSIFQESYGNPLYIEEIIKMLYTNKYIYIDDKRGIWSSKYQDYKGIPIPSSMLQVISNQIKELDDKSIEILMAISVFRIPILLETITNFFNGSKEVKNIVGNLVERGILSIKAEDRGNTYDFRNKALKGIIYNKVEENELIENHKKASVVLEKQYSEDYTNYKDELIYHLKMAKEYEKVIDYCLENADRMDKLKIRIEVIRNLNDALSAFPKDRVDVKKVKILKRLADSYSNDGNIENAITYYEAAKEDGLKINEMNYVVDSLNKIAVIYLNKNDFVNAKKYIDESTKLLNNMDYMEGKLENAEYLSNLYFKTQQYEKAADVCKSAINKCKDEHILYKSRLINILGNVYSFKSQPEEALKCFNESLKYSESIGDSIGKAKMLNNIGTMYVNHYGDVDKAIEYWLKANEVCEMANLTSLKPLILSNIASFYMSTYKYDKAIKYFEKAIDNAQRIGRETIVIYSLNYIISGYLRTFNYKRAYECYLMSEEKHNNPLQEGTYNSFHYDILVEFFYTLGDINNAKKYISVYSNDQSFTTEDSTLGINIISKQIEILESNDYEKVEVLSKEIEDLIEKVDKDEDKVDELLAEAVFLCDLGYKLLAADLLHKANDIKKKCDYERIELRRIYLNAVLNKEFKLSYMENALRLSEKLNENGINIKVLTALGDHYFNEKNYYYSFNYYYEACEAIVKLTSELPENMRLGYINKNRYRYPFDMIRKIKYEYINNQISVDNNDIYVSTLTELAEIFNYRDFDDILKNKKFINSAKEMYSIFNGFKIYDEKDVIENLTLEPIENLKNIIKHLSCLTLATKGFIIVEEDNEYKSLTGITNFKDDFDIKYYIEMAKEKQETIFINVNKSDNDSINIDNGFSKILFCIPIIMNEKSFRNNILEKRSKDNNKIIGYIYLESTKILNNFNEDSLSKCMHFQALCGVLAKKFLLKQSAAIDKLTGALTRKYLEDTIIAEIDYANKNNDVFSIIMIDIDYFKGINDKFGHRTGDQTLKDICDIIQKNIRKEDAFGRYGGEEFIVVLPGIETKNAQIVAEKLRKKIEKADVLEGKRTVTISAGISTYPVHAEWKQELIEKADQALYIAKNAGRNKCVVWKNDFSEKMKGTNKLTGIISGDLVQDQRNALTFIDIIALLKEDLPAKDKLYSFLGRVIEVIEAQYGYILTIEDNNYKECYGRKIFEDNWIDVNKTNSKIIEQVYSKKVGTYMIDWDTSTDYDAVTGMPDWQSIMCIPLICNGILKGILYLMVSTRIKEFNYNDYNFINTLSEIAAAIL